MPNYRYQIRTSNGQVQTGVVSADNLSTASAILRNQGAHILSLAAAVGGVDTTGLMAKFRELNAGKPTQKNAASASGKHAHP